MSILDNLGGPEDVRALDGPGLQDLAAELRATIVRGVSKTGGHLSSNLGVVELTLAIHRVYDTAKDRLVFDVGHQCYTHKLITGRADRFDTLRTLDGISGFPKPCESVHDAFIAGHASAAVSVALGMARARTLTGADYDVVALVGDGALTGGLAYEGLSDAGGSGEPLVVVLNDNGMSINRSVGGISRLLARQRIKPGYLRFKRAYRKVVGRIPPLYNFLHRLKERLKDLLLPASLFEDMGFFYLGPVDGHNIAHLESALRWAKALRAPVVLHAITQKGRGYAPAQQDPERFHGVGSFDPDTGKTAPAGRNFSSVFGETMVSLAAQDASIVAVTAAMEDGTGLTGFANRYPDRFFDIGIAEGHAVALTGGMAKQGLRPVFAIYSTFLPRACDMLIHDLALQNLHAVFCVDRAGLVGEDGETHQGAFDLNLLCAVPHMTVFAPASFAELREMLEHALYRVEGPVALRYPRGGEGLYKGCRANGTYTVLKDGDDVTLVGYGVLIGELLAAAALLEERGVSASVIKINVLHPFTQEDAAAIAGKTPALVVAEDVCAAGCFGQALLSAAAQQGAVPTKAALMNLGEGIVRHGSVSRLRALCGLDAAAIAGRAMGLVSKENA